MGRGLVITEPQEWRRDRWRSALLCGMTMEAVGAAEGITRERVRQVIGFQWRKDRMAEERKEALEMTIRLRTEHPGMTATEILRRVGGTMQDVVAALKAHGLNPRAERTPKHGTDSEYLNHKCRCGPCVAAHRAYVAKVKATMRTKALAAGSIPHGRGGYTNYQCRCGVCLDAMAQHIRSPEYSARIATARAKARFKAVPEGNHGTSHAYNYYWCRCDLCRNAKREYNKDLYRRKRASRATPGDTAVPHTVSSGA